MARGPLVILSGPSGAGKSTVIQRLLESADLPLRCAVSATTRERRDYEVDGRHYHFWDRDSFCRHRDAGDLLEFAEVHGQLYGTPCSEVEPYREKGVGVVLVIDVQGFDQVRTKCGDLVSIFLEAPDYETRLRLRGEAEERIRRRLRTAEAELPRAAEYMYRVINDDLETAVSDVRRIIQSHFPGR